MCMLHMPPSSWLNLLHVIVEHSAAAPQSLQGFRLIRNAYVAVAIHVVVVKWSTVTCDANA